MSLRHTVLIRFTDDATEEQVASLATGLDGLPGQIDQVRDYEHGRDAGVREGTWDYAVVAKFDSAADFTDYLRHPAHVKVVRELLEPISAERTSVQFHLG